eukprot:gene5987-6225_t
MTTSAGSYSVLEIERDRLQKALLHLEQSVLLLKAAIVEAGPDPDYKDAIDENVTVIAKYRARIAALDDEIKCLKGMKGDISSTLVAAVPVIDRSVSSLPFLQQVARMHSLTVGAASHHNPVALSFSA